MQHVPPDMLSMEVTTETNPDERDPQSELDSRYITKMLFILCLGRPNSDIGVVP